MWGEAVVLMSGRVAADGATDTAVVIGSAGFIGRRLSATLDLARVRTACFTRQSRFLLDGELAAPISEAGTVFYLASSINPALGETHPELAEADHVLFRTLLDRLRRRDNPPTVVLTSSGGTVYDPAFAPPYAETSPLKPSGAYGRAKVALEEELLSHAGELPAVILRMSNVYGPGQPTGRGQGVLAHWLSAALDSRPLRLIGDVTATRDYVYVDDVVDVMRRLRGAGPAEPLILNVGSGVRTSLSDLLDVVRSVVALDLRVEFQPSRLFDRQDVWLDVGEAERVLGWRPGTSLAEGVAATWRSWLAGAAVTAGVNELQTIFETI